MYAEMFVRKGGKGENLSVLFMLYLVCRGPKYNWSSVSTDPVPRAPRN